MSAFLERFAAPTAPGFPPIPLSESVRAGDTIYISGVIGVDFATMKTPEAPEDEARLVMTYFKNAVERAGYGMDDVVSVQVFATDLDLFALFNEVYRGFFPNGFPARAFLGTSKLLAGGRFEVLGVAVKP